MSNEDFWNEPLGVEYVKLRANESAIVEFVGPVTKREQVWVGDRAMAYDPTKHDRDDVRVSYVFDVLDAEGSPKKLQGSYRLAKAIQAAVTEHGREGQLYLIERTGPTNKPVYTCEPAPAKPAQAPAKKTKKSGDSWL